MVQRPLKSGSIECHSVRVEVILMEVARLCFTAPKKESISVKAPKRNTRSGLGKSGNEAPEIVSDKSKRESAPVMQSQRVNYKTKKQKVEELEETTVSVKERRVLSGKGKASIIPGLSGKEGTSFTKEVVKNENDALKQESNVLSRRSQPAQRASRKSATHRLGCIF